MKGPRRHRGRLFRLVAGVQLGVSLFALAGCLFSPLSLFAHFQLQLALGWVASLLLLWSWPRLRAAFWRPGMAKTVAAAFLLFHGGLLWWAFRPYPEEDLETPTTLDLVWFNLHHDVAALRDLQDHLAAAPPDIVCLGEVDPAMDWGLPGYAFRHRAPKGDVLIVSRWPLEQKRVVALDEGREILSATVVAERRRFTLIATHLRTPIRLSHRPGMAQLAAMATRAEQAVVVGDLNSTPWAAEFRRLEKDGGLHHARRGRGYLASWGMLPGKLMRLPIDHALLKGRIAAKRFELLPWMHSDHRAFRLGLALGGPRRRGASGDG